MRTTMKETGIGSTYPVSAYVFLLGISPTQHYRAY